MTDLNETSAKPARDKKIFAYACFILARRRYSVSEFRGKLEKKFPDKPEEVTQIIDLFLERKYLDDSEYARIYILDQLARKPQGLRLIKQKLRHKGINETTLSGTFQEQIYDEDELIRQALTKKARTLTSAPPRLAKQKLFRFLISRGFGYENIMKALSAENPFTDS